MSTNLCSIALPIKRGNSKSEVRLAHFKISSYPLSSSVPAVARRRYSMLLAMLRWKAVAQKLKRKVAKHIGFHFHISSNNRIIPLGRDMPHVIGRGNAAASSPYRRKLLRLNAPICLVILARFVRWPFLACIPVSSGLRHPIWREMADMAYCSFCAVYVAYRAS